MSVHRCDWCGRFYSSQLPEGSACGDHIHDHNIRLRKQIERFNSRLQPRDSAAPLPECDPSVRGVENINEPSELPPSPERTEEPT